MILRVIPLIVIAVLFAQQDATAGALTNKGADIALQTQQNLAGFNAFSAAIQMTLKDTDEKKTVYQLTLAAVREKRGDTRKLFVVDEPANLKGTALLIHSRENRESEHWFYLSARKRVKRIYPCFQSGRFLNSEWTYEDMNGHVWDNYDHQLIGNDTIEGRFCFMIEATLKNNAVSGYSKQIQWIDKETYDILKIEYYDHRKELLKTLTLTGYQAYSGNFRHAREMNMIDNKTGKTMQVKYLNFGFNPGPERVNFDKEQFYKGINRPTAETTTVQLPELSGAMTRPVFSANAEGNRE